MPKPLLVPLPDGQFFDASRIDEVEEPLKAELLELMNELGDLYEADPLQRFAPHPCPDCGLYVNGGCERHRTPQLDWFRFQAKVQAAFAGNRFGKTTGLVVKVLVQHRDPERLPAHLREYRLTQEVQPVMGRLLVPSERALLEYTIPKFKEWTPKDMFLGGSWDNAWDKQHNILRFSGDQGQIGIYTYRQDPETMVGSALDYVGYDEPPPESHRNESLARLIDRDGFEMFALTPVNMKGGGIGWLYRKIWKRREAPGVDVVKASIHDNPTLSPGAVERVLSEFDDEERQAREFGDFLHFGGMVYARGFESILVDPPTREHVQKLDVVVGIDPGLRNAAFVWNGFDRDNVALMFDEGLLQDKTPADYAELLALKNASWGWGSQAQHQRVLGWVKERHSRGEVSDEEFARKSQLLSRPTNNTDPVYVIDPSARNRNPTNAESVKSELQRLGVFAFDGQNDVEGGVQHIRRRIQFGGV